MLLVSDRALAAVDDAAGLVIDLTLLLKAVVLLLLRKGIAVVVQAIDVVISSLLGIQTRNRLLLLRSIELLLLRSIELLLLGRSILLLLLRSSVLLLLLGSSKLQLLLKRGRGDKTSPWGGAGIARGARVDVHGAGCGALLPSLWRPLEAVPHYQRDGEYKYGGPTFGDFVIIGIEVLMQDVTVARL